MRSLIAIVALLAFGVAGCSQFTSGQPVVRYDKGKSPVLQEAPMAGIYALYSRYDSNPQFTISLDEGDKLGFEASETGRITAIAGDEEYDLPDAHYIWKRK